MQATSNESLYFVECGVYSQLVKDFQRFDMQDILGRELISQEASDDIVLFEYQHDDLVLSSDGTDEKKLVACCKICLHHVRNGKCCQVSLSIANNFQFGSIPPALVNSTLPEKLLISVYRLRRYVTTLCSFAGSKTAQSA